MRPGVVDPAGHPIRLDLELLGEQDLFNLARNPDAVHRALALHLLFERDSAFLKRAEIANEVRQYRLDHDEDC